MRIEKLWAGFVLSGAFVVLISFQNCSDVKVSEKPSIVPPPPPIVPLATPIGDLCAPQGVVFGAPVRIVIVLDMSMSNIGLVEGGGEYPSTWWRIDTDAGPSDLNGDRFAQVKDFITNCGSNTNAKYSIIGFSNTSQFARGQSCVSPFESQQDAVRTVDALKAQQDWDKARTWVNGPYPYNLGTETNYIPAANCLEQKVLEDLALLENGERPAYYSFFLTDGQPTDDGASFIPTLQAKISNINVATMGAASGFHFQGIYYTSPGANNQGAQQAAALAKLTAMTQVTEGPSGAAINVTQLGTTQAQLCAKIQPSSHVDYNLKSLYAVNLSAIMKKNIIEADSDMDGVSDKEEIAMSWAADNARSTGVLDGICYWSTKNKTQCQTVATGLASSCNANNFTQGMTDCDRAYAAKLTGRLLSSADIDRDSISNFIEIIRGTSLARADMMDNPTADGINNFLKITQGMDVHASTVSWPIGSEYLMDIKYEVDAGTCDNGLAKINYSLDHVPLAEVLKYTDPSTEPGMNLSHEKDENVVLVFSVWQSSGGITLPNRMYVQKWIVPKTADPRKEEVKFLGEF